jgi:hypothetical protein
VEVINRLNDLQQQGIGAKTLDGLIWETAKNPTPTGQPHCRGKDARRRRAHGLILDAA